MLFCALPAENSSPSFRVDCLLSLIDRKRSPFFFLRRPLSEITPTGFHIIPFALMLVGSILY
jgi:hypothetical protein